jgi:hypothetical protein
MERLIFTCCSYCVKSGRESVLSAQFAFFDPGATRPEGRVPRSLPKAAAPKQNAKKKNHSSQADVRQWPSTLMCNKTFNQSRNNYSLPKFIFTTFPSLVPKHMWCLLVAQQLDLQADLSQGLVRWQSGFIFGDVSHLGHKKSLLSTQRLQSWIISQ